MELIDYLRMLRRRWVVVLLCAFLGALGGIAWVKTTTPSYSATAESFVGVRLPAGVDNKTISAQSGSQYVLDRMQSYAELVGSAAVAQPVIKALGVNESIDQFAAGVTASVPPKTVLLRVTAVSADPRTASRTATLTAQQLGSVIERYEGSGTTGGSFVTVTLTGPAEVPSARSGASPAMRIGLLLILGLGLGVLAASLIDQARGGSRRATPATASAAASQTGVTPSTPRAATLAPAAVRSSPMPAAVVAPSAAAPTRGSGSSAEPRDSRNSAIRRLRRRQDDV